MTGIRSNILNKYNSPITNSKSAPANTLKPPYVARSVGRINRQFEIDALASIGRKFAPLTGRRWREQNRFHSHNILHFFYRDKRYIAKGDY